MKSFISLSAAICILFTINAEIIRTPAFKARNTPIIQIDSIDSRNDLCRFHITLHHRPNAILQIDSLILTEPQKKKIWIPTDIDGIYFGRSFQFPDSGVISVEIDYPPIPSSVTNVDLAEMKKEVPFKIIGIKLDNTPIPLQARQKTSHISRNKQHKPVSSFKKDSAFIQGYIKGYHPRLEFGNGVIHQDNIITNTVRDIPVIIDSLGNFTVGLLLDYPIQQTIFFQKGYLHFYIEPGGFLKIETSMDVLTTPYRYVEETDLSDTLTRYGGNMGKYNQELKLIRQLYGIEDNSWIKDLQTLEPEAYKYKQDEWLKHRTEILSRLTDKNHISSHMNQLARLNILYRYGRKLLQYAEYQQNRHKKIDQDFYLFLNLMPLDNIYSLSSEDYKLFISLLEKSEPLVSIPNWNPGEFIEAMQKQGITPSPDEKKLILAIFGQDKPFITDMSTRMDQFNLKYKDIQIAMKEAKSTSYKSKIYNKWGDTGDITFQLLNSRIFIPRLKFIGRKLSPNEFKNYNQYIHNKFILDKLKKINRNYPLIDGDL